MSTALQLSKTCLSRTRVLQQSSSVSTRLVRAIATQSNRTKAPQAMMMIQPSNNVHQSSLAPSSNKTKKTEPSRRIRRLTTTSPVEQDLLVDMQALEALASQRPTPLRLKDMHLYASSGDFQQRLRNAQFLHKELPIRMAQRAMDLLTLPHGLNEMKHVRQVASVYLRYIEQFQQMPPPTTTAQEAAFTDMLSCIMLDRQHIPMAIAQGISSWYHQAHHPDDLDPEHLAEMEHALYRFFTARVGLRFLTQHHILSDPHRSCSSDKALDSSQQTGCIQTNCDAVHEIQQVIEQVTLQTKDCYGCCPNIEIVDCNLQGKSMAGFTYVPHHLQYMMMELLKNSCRATVDRYIGQDHMPPIRVVVAQGKEDVTIKVCDQGGGAPRSTMEKIWKFAHSTSPSLEQETEFAKDSFSGGKIRGFGLPLARIYARYFGGELTLLSTEGHGVDAYLYLPRLGYQCENLPDLVKTSPGEGDSTVTARDFDLCAIGPIVQRPPNGETTETAVVV